MTCNTKTCSSCREDKSLSRFSKSSSSKTGRHAYCKECMAEYDKSRRKKPELQEYFREKDSRTSRRVVWRKSHLQRVYGVSEELYDYILRSQDFVCAICHREESRENRSLSLDHCHESGKIRGLLCDSCNNGIARFNDDPEVLENAIAYLQDSEIFYGKI